MMIAQEVVSVLANCTRGDVDALLTGEARLMPEKFDRVCAKTQHQRKAVREHLSGLPSDQLEFAKSLLSDMLDAGCTAFHHHTAEHQLVQIVDDPAKQEKHLGAACNLPAERKRKRRLGVATTHAQACS